MALLKKYTMEHHASIAERRKAIREARNGIKPSTAETPAKAKSTRKKAVEPEVEVEAVEAVEEPSEEVPAAE